MSVARQGRVEGEEGRGLKKKGYSRVLPTAVFATCVFGYLVVLIIEDDRQGGV